MSELSSWNQTAAAVVRRGYVDYDPVPPDRPGNLLERDVAKRQFDEAWSATISVQEHLAARGWPGCWIDMGDTRPFVLRPLYDQHTADEQTQLGTFSPNHRDPFVLEMEAQARAKREQAMARMADLNAKYPALASVALPGSG